MEFSKYTTFEREKYKNALYDKIATVEPYPEGRFAGRGIVTTAGGQSYLAGAWASFKMLRAAGVDLPMQLWFFGDDEFDDVTRKMFEGIDVECIKLEDVLKRYTTKTLTASRIEHRRFALFEMKCYAILHSRFEEVLFLDADNVPMRDPRPLFDDPGYRETGALFWPDPPYGARPPDANAWAACGLEQQPGPAFETGQLLLNKRHCWVSLNVTWWINRESDYWFSLIFGDKDSYKLVWHSMKLRYALAPSPRSTLFGVIQHLPDGTPAFYHRWFLKPSMHDRYLGVAGVPPAINLAYMTALEEMRSQWDGRFWNDASLPRDGIVGVYHLVAHGRSCYVFLKEDRTVAPVLPEARFWHLTKCHGALQLVLQGAERITGFLDSTHSGWRGVETRGHNDVTLTRIAASPSFVLFLRLRSAASKERRELVALLSLSIRAVELFLIHILGESFVAKGRSAYRKIIIVFGIAPRR